MIATCTQQGYWLKLMWNLLHKLSALFSFIPQYFGEEPEDEDVLYY